MSGSDGALYPNRHHRSQRTGRDDPAGEQRPAWTRNTDASGNGLHAQDRTDHVDIPPVVRSVDDRPHRAHPSE
ncbi:hypothetical protein [Nocardia asiatica]|uniref:hypothetical protein n=1 Tax=Nocardia asiatica TaxID=209252 RepID=UPI002458EA73|nr:hypothetical protein [Nocardia asiatica]